jgi:calcineurin-like phosphoesterase family protein
VTTWFTADTHFWHKGNLHHRKPTYATVEEMHTDLIEKWNARVKVNDKVYHLGDLSFAGLEKTVAVIGQLNGCIKLVPGNHDDPKLMRKLEALGLIEVLPPLFDLKLVGTAAEPGARIVLCHYPLMTWNRMHYGALHLHGHCHGNLSDDGKVRRMDVGIDAHGRSAPIELELVVQHLAERTGVYHDHHRPENLRRDIPASLV